MGKVGGDKLESCERWQDSEAAGLERLEGRDVARWERQGLRERVVRR